MRATNSGYVTLLAALALVGTARAQTILLSEPPRAGDCFRITTATNLSGVLKVTRNGKQTPVHITAKNEHQWLERIQSADKGLARKSIRYYLQAISRATVDGAKIERQLSAERRLIVAQRTGDALICYSPSGPLSQSEFEVTSEHFDTLHLTGVLPGREIKIGDAWKVDSEVIQSLCLFDGLISHEVMAKLKDADAHFATIAIEGPAKGIDNGAMANLTIAATVRYDRDKKRIVSVEWKQKDVRDQGPTAPAAEVESTTVLKREFLDREPAEFNAAALALVPATNDPPAAMQQLSHRDSRSRYQLRYSRDWHVVGQTDYHLVMRLLDRGDFVAQATLTCWKNVGAGKHMTPEEFEKLISEGTGWKMETVMEKIDVPSDGGHWIYRIVAAGELDGSKVIQNFYVVAAATGDQMIVTFTMKPNAAERIGSRDLAIVNAIEFPRK